MTMTKEEAIEDLLRHYTGESTDMAIEALKQEPCEDAVSRKEVIDGINQYFHDEYYQRTSIQDCRDCLIEDVIKPLPSVNPQPKIGHWIEDEYEMKVWCSECGEENDMCSKYCPNCSAKMQAESKG